MSSIKTVRDELVEAMVEYSAARIGLDKAFDDFGKQFRKTRQANGLSLRDVAKKLHLSAAYLSDVELGRRKANKEALHFFKD